MSRLGKKPISLPAGVSVSESDGVFIVSGARGKVSVKKIPYVSVAVLDSQIKVSCSAGFKQARANWGTMWSLLNNAVLGVINGFSKKLEINGVGYRAEVSGNKLVLNLGFSHPINFPIPEGISVSVDKNIITVSGIDKELVGFAAAKIRSFRRPEPYKGKGIKYTDEIIIRKAGKKVGATA